MRNAHSCGLTIFRLHFRKAFYGPHLLRKSQYTGRASHSWYEIQQARPATKDTNRGHQIPDHTAPDYPRMCRWDHRHAFNPLGVGKRMQPPKITPTSAPTSTVHSTHPLRHSHCVKHWALWRTKTQLWGKEVCK